MCTDSRASLFIRPFVLFGKSHLFTIFLLLMGIPGYAQSGTITLVQHASKDAGSTTSSTLGFGANNTAGNFIVVCVRAGALNEVIAVSDTRTNLYHRAIQFNQTADGFTGAIFYAENIGAGANTVTVSDNISGTLRFSILEYSGVATSASLDVATAAQGHSTAPSSAPSVNTTANGDLLVGTMMTGNNDNFTAGAGYKIEESAPGQGNAKLIVEDQIQSISGGATATATIGSTDDWAAGLAAFKAGNGTGGTGPTITSLNPTSGVAGTSVVITGTNFGSPQGTSTVKFNGVTATPTAWGATSITAPVPTGATTGSVIVTVAGLASNGVTFTVPPSPSVTINQAAAQADPTNASTINFTAVFSAAVTGFSSTGVTLSGTAGAKTVLVTGSGTTYNIAVSGMTQTGTVTASIAAGKATDLAGNLNTASTSTDNTVTYNAAAPSVTINQATGQADPTNASPINFTAVFSTAVTGFSNTGVTLSGTAGATTVVVTGSGTTYNVAVSGMTQTGTVTASIPAGVATANGSTNTASTSTDNTVTYDITPPTVTVNQAASQTDPTGTSPINFTAVFSQTVTGFTSSGVTLGGTAGATTAVVTGSGTTYNVAVSGMTQSGTVTASIPTGAASDLAGNPSTASTSTDNTVTYNAQSGLVAAYSFEEGTGTTTADSSGNNNTGTLSSGVTWTTGRVGNAVSFNGTSGDITINDAPSLDLNGSFSLSAWVNPATVSGTETLLIKETTTGCSYFLQIVNGQIDSGFNNGSSCIEHVTTNANLVAANWYLLTAVLDHNGNTYNTYLNGSLIASVAETGVPAPNTQPLVFGRSGCSTCGFERLNGILDEVKIYNRALSASEVQTLFSAAVGGPAITGLSPTSGVTGTSVVITGTNFGNTQGSSTVKFNGVTSTPTAWGATSITAPVPTGATTGSVTVTVTGLSSNGVNFTVTNLSVTINPKRAAVTLFQPQQFTGTVNNDPQNGGVSWSVDGVGGGSPATGTVSSTGLYTPGTQPGGHTVTATSNSSPSTSATATVAVTDLPGVFTYHNDNARTGQNVQEYALTPSTVNSSTFGALFSCAVDGYLYATPLYVAGLNVGGQTRNVVYVATEHDSVYAFDADSPACVQLWQVNFLATGVTTVSPADVSEPNDLVPEIGITSTPVIDPSTKTIYVMAKTKETVGTSCSTTSPCFVHRLHALDLITGAEKFGGPVVVTGTNFDPLTHLQRPALLLNNGTVYVAIGSHGDNGIWQGWMMAYTASTLAQQWVYHTSDPTTGNNGGAIWGSGNGPAVDSSGNIYVETGNGFFDGVNNFSDSVLKISPAGARLDYFTPFDQQIMQNNDIDLGSSNPIILPDSMGSSAHPHLLIAMGKVGVIYLLDQTSMGGFNSASNQDVEEVSISFNTSSAINGFYGQPAYWNGNLYAIVVGDSLRQFTISNGSISSASISHSGNTFTFRGATPVVSAGGTANGIVWVADITAYQSNGATILDAYDANNVSVRLYTSPSSGAGAAAPATKFTVPTVANGKVYVGGQRALTVFGLLPN
jgi:Concanavalin A-like lectin/glucanases superfamily/IPT/TIG domain